MLSIQRKSADLHLSYIITCCVLATKVMRNLNADLVVNDKIICYKI